MDRYVNQPGKPFGGEPTPEHPFKVFVHLPGEQPATNGLSFATVEDARANGNDLLGRWFVPTGFEVRNVLTGEVVA